MLNKELASVCGLFCASCGVFYATQEKDFIKLQEIAKKLDIPFDKVNCYGCRSNEKIGSCVNCFIAKCAEEKGVEFCIDCDTYPCGELKEFQKKMPHRKNMWKSLARIKEVGWEKWFVEMFDYYTCQKCNTMNGAYNIECRKCGNSPGNDFVKENML